MKSKRVVPSKYWCFTFHCDLLKGKDILETMETLETYFKGVGVNYLIGEEYGENNNTPHLQGYIESEKKIRPIEAFDLDKDIHWEKRKGSRLDNFRYISKEGFNIVSISRS